jgi:hypothetical protein
MYHVYQKQMKLEQANEYLASKLARFGVTKQESEDLSYILQCGHDYTDHLDLLLFRNITVNDDVTQSAHSMIYKLLPKAPKNDDSVAKSA